MTEELAGFSYRFEAPDDADAPVLLLLHGTGGDEHQLLTVGRAVAPDAALLAPRGQVVESDQVPRYFRRIPTEDGSAYPYTFDPTEVRERVADLAGFVAAAVERHGLGGRPVVAAGFSNGANAAAVLLLDHPETLRGGALVAPMPVLDDPGSADLSAHAALVAGGRRDPIATPDHVEAVAETLADRGARVTVHWHSSGHDFEASTVEAARSWLDKLRQATATDPLP